MLKAAVMYLLCVAVICANVHELLAIGRERVERIEAKQKTARLYVNRKPFEQWAEASPDGEPIQYKLFIGYREETLLFVLRESGHYVERDSLDEFTVDRELCFEEGISLLSHKRRAIDDSTPEYEE